MKYDLRNCLQTNMFGEDISLEKVIQRDEKFNKQLKNKKMEEKAYELIRNSEKRFHQIEIGEIYSD